MPGNKNFSGVISVVLTRLVSGNNMTSSSTYSTYAPTAAPGYYNSTDSGNGTSTRGIIETIKRLDQDVRLFAKYIYILYTLYPA